MAGRLGFFGGDVVVIAALQADLDRHFGHISETPFWNRRPPSALEELASSWGAYRFGLRRCLRKDRFVGAAEVDSVCRSNLGVYLEVARRAREAGARVLMVWHPSRAALGHGDDSYREAFLAGCRRDRYAALDMSPLLRRAERPRQFYVDPVHLHSRGHAFYGKAPGGALAELVRGRP